MFCICCSAIMWPISYGGTRFIVRWVPCPSRTYANFNTTQQADPSTQTGPDRPASDMLLLEISWLLSVTSQVDSEGAAEDPTISWPEVWNFLSDFAGLPHQKPKFVWPFVQKLMVDVDWWRAATRTWPCTRSPARLSVSALGYPVSPANFRPNPSQFWTNFVRIVGQDLVGVLPVAGGGRNVTVRVSHVRMWAPSRSQSRTNLNKTMIYYLVTTSKSAFNFDLLSNQIWLHVASFLKNIDG